METILLIIAFWWIMAWVAYCVAWALGYDLWVVASPFVAEIGLATAAVLLVYAAFRAYRFMQERTRFAPGDHVVYLMQKFSAHPGRRAERVQPTPRGEGYCYFVRKPWTVVRVVNDKAIEVVTNGGKHHILATDDPHLHKPGPIEWVMLKLRWRKDFPEPATVTG